jgi:hypothetical protein
MKLIGPAFIFLMLLSQSCGDVGLSPAGPQPGITDQDGRDGVSADCHGNMLRLRRAESIYYSTYGYDYTDDLQMLYGILGVDSLVCPSCGLEYVIRADESTFRIGCPMPSSPNHGFVQGFYVSWPPEDLLATCHDYMVYISNAMLCFYFSYGYGVGSLEELAAFLDVPVEWLSCPENGAYQIWSQGYESRVECPTCGSSISHGFILNGNPSWPPDPVEFCEICQSNMLNIRTGLCMFYSRMGHFYPDSLDDPLFLEVLGNADHLYCPACVQYYLYEVDPDRQGYWLSCPLPYDPNHGEIIDGEPSWQ